MSVGRGYSHPMAEGITLKGLPADNPPTMQPTVADVLSECFLHLAQAKNNAANVKGKLFGFEPQPAVEGAKLSSEPPIYSLVCQLRDRLRILVKETGEITARLAVAFCLLFLVACSPTTYTRVTNHADGSVSVHEIDYQRDWWSNLDQPDDFMGVKGERQFLLLPDGTKVTHEAVRCRHEPVKPTVVYCIE